MVILYTIFGWKIGTLYLISGILVEIVGGIVIETLDMEKQVEEYVYNIDVGETDIEELNWDDRINYAKEEVKEIVGRFWKYVIIGIGLEAVINGYAPAELLAEYAGPNNPLSVIAAVIVGIPLYANAVGTIPIVEALMGKGVVLGTALSYMMATTALSLPALIILRKVIKPKLITVFVMVVGFSIIGVGYMFNFVINFV